MNDSVSTDLNYWTNRISPKFNVLNYCVKSYIIIYTSKIKPRSVRIRFLIWQIICFPWRDSNSHLRPLSHIRYRPCYTVNQVSRYLYHATLCIMILASLHTKSSSMFHGKLFHQNGESWQWRHYHPCLYFANCCWNSAIQRESFRKIVG